MASADRLVTVAVCEHLDQVREVTPSSMTGCTDCLASGGQWVHLRLCLSCGHVGCCDSSPVMLEVEGLDLPKHH